MSYMPQEQVLLPAPECTVPPPEYVNTTIMDMHARLFEAASRPMAPEQRRFTQSSHKMWEVCTKDITLRIIEYGDFNNPPTLESIKEKGFEVRLHAGEPPHREGSLEADVAQDSRGEFVLSNERACDQAPRLPRRFRDIGITALHSLLAGEIVPDLQKTSRGVGVYDFTIVAPYETITQHGDNPPVTTSALSVSRPSSSSFIAETSDGGRSMDIRYKDDTNYGGSFGIDLRKIPMSPALCIMFSPYTSISKAQKFPERLACDEKIDQTRNVLTTGRFKGVQQRVELALQDLAEFHQKYLAAQV